MDTKQYTFDGDTVSDLYKDAFGFRPDAYWWTQWDQFTDEQKQEEWNYLCKVLDDARALEEVNYNSCIARLEDRLYELQRHGAKNRAMAIRWLDEAYETHGDINFLEWHLGVPYGYLKGYN